MRGCLTVLILAAVFVVAGAWFGGPPIAEAVVSAGLSTAGLSAEHLDVDVEANPPLELALGRADRVLVDATDADWHGIKAQRIDLDLRDIDFVARSAGHVSGRMTGVELPSVEPKGSLATIDIDGPGDAATATITIDGPTFEAIATEAFDEKLGIRPSSVTLAEPNVLRVVAGPISASSGMTVESDGSLGVATPLGTVTVLDAESSSPLHLTNVAVENGSLVLTGTVDLDDLIG